MKNSVALLFLFCVWMIQSCTSPQKQASTGPIKIILDTDIGPDFDDVGAVAVLHAMADSGKVEILGIMACNKDSLVVPVIDVLNTYFGRPAIPVGSPKSKGVKIGSDRHWPDSIVARYPHKIRSTNEAPDAVAQYRKILSAQPDGLVTIVSIGFITNLNNLLQSPADQISTLNGIDLVARKVKKLVSMAGWYPKGKEYNVDMDSTASIQCFEHWPTPVIFTGFEIGDKVKTGLKLVGSTVQHSPVKDAFRIAMNGSKDDLKGHSSWDQTAVLIAIFGTEPFFTTVKGTIRVSRDGSNTWDENPAGKHAYVKFSQSPENIGKFIETRMMHEPSSPTIRSISKADLKDKIAGGWAGKMLGVTYGAPTEFRALGKTYEKPIIWAPKDAIGSLTQDDLYVQLTFLMTMDQYGMDAPAKKYQELFAKAGYMLWHANAQSRKNYFDSIFPPRSGAPEFNFHANDIDFQIEADYLGFMSPGMPNSAAKLADKIGHIMNFGDGVYGGIFLSAMYAEAFFEKDIRKIVEKALTSLPSESDYAKIIQDVLLLKDKNPEDWRAVWKILEDKWGKTHICTAGEAFNIDAKFNGAFIVIGLLYGGGDPDKTLEITTRCGQDSDCNPSNALAVLGVINGFSHLPEAMQKAVGAMQDSLFIFTNYSFRKAVDQTMKYALTQISASGGKADVDPVLIKVQKPEPAPFEVSFPKMALSEKVSIFDEKRWKLSGDWQIFPMVPEDGTKKVKQSKVASKKGDTLEFSFEGTAISLEGNWKKDAGKAELYIDGKLHSTFDTYFYYNQQEQTPINICHALKLTRGKHILKIVITGEKKPESLDSRIYVSDALVFK
ncbi:MAG TPA: ADP-ribosylglycohydrolase family protein [Prolixibacteraceae bacterium]